MMLSVLFIFILMGLIAYRDWCVFITREALFDSDDELDKYLALPDYDAMVYNPRYWLRWTPAQWERAL
jgi:hypothetical protein